MATRSSIEWTETTWNPVTGCSKASPGCLHCYAERMAKRLKAMGASRTTSDGFALRSAPGRARCAPRVGKAPRTVFVNSMSDLFHEEVPLEFIQRVFDVMNRARSTSFQILTKRAARLRGAGGSTRLDAATSGWA